MRRVRYQKLLTDSESPVVFPHGDIGWILANGQRSRDGRTLFARRILSFHPEVEQRRFRVPLRKVCFVTTTPSTAMANRLLNWRPR